MSRPIVLPNGPRVANLPIAHVTPIIQSTSSDSEDIWTEHIQRWERNGQHGHFDSDFETESDRSRSPLQTERTEESNITSTADMIRDCDLRLHNLGLRLNASPAEHEFRQLYVRLFRDLGGLLRLQIDDEAEEIIRSHVYRFSSALSDASRQLDIAESNLTNSYGPTSPIYPTE